MTRLKLRKLLGLTRKMHSLPHDMVKSK